MATEKQLRKLELVQKMIEASKDKRDIPKNLSMKRIGYEQAVKSMMKAGEYGTVIPLAVMLISILSMASAFLAARYGQDLEQVTTITMVVVVFSIIAMPFGKKLWDLSATPLLTIVCLLALAAYNLFGAAIMLYMHEGILPLIAGILLAISLIFDIIALTRYSTFCSWFNNIKLTNKKDND